MSFFTKPIINSFMNKIKNIGYTDNVYFVQLSDIINLNPTITPEAILTPIIENACGNNIGPDYINTIKSLYRNPSTASMMNMIILLDKPLDVFFDKNRQNKFNTRDYSGKNVLGLLITQLNECKKYPTVHTINLICSTSGKGTLLMALYMYVIKSQPNVNVVNNQQIGLLELANGYINVGGLCMYSKFGYKYDETLYGNDCFYAYENLPMKALLADYNSADTIINILDKTGTKPHPTFEKPAICKLANKEMQPLLGMCLNLLIILKFNKPVKSFTTSTYVIYDYPYLWETVCNKQIDVLNALISDIYTNKDVNVNIEKIIVHPMPRVSKKHTIEDVKMPMPVSQSITIQQPIPESITAAEPSSKKHKGRVGFTENIYGGQCSISKRTKRYRKQMQSKKHKRSKKSKKYVK